MSPTRRQVPAVLARHGIDPAAGASELTAALAARGWEVTVEETAGGRHPRWRAMAFRHAAGGVMGAGLVASRRASGATAAAALGRLAAAILEAAEP